MATIGYSMERCVASLACCGLSMSDELSDDDLETSSMSRPVTLFGTAAVKKPFFPDLNAESSFYYRTINALWELYPGNDRQKFFLPLNANGWPSSRATRRLYLPCWSGWSVLAFGRVQDEN